MSDDPRDEQRVRDYLRARSSRPAPHELVPGAMRRIQATPQLVEPWWRRPALTGLAIGGSVGALALAAALVMALLGGDRSRPPVGTSPSPVSSATAAPSDSPSASASPTTPVSVVPPGLTLQRMPFEGRVDAVHATEDGFLAVGEGADGWYAWSSVDGTSWEAHRLPHQSPFVDGSVDMEQSVHPGHLVEHDGWYYAIGTVQGPVDAIMPRAWRSPDGVSWEEVVSESDFYRIGYVVMDVESGDPGLLVATHGFGNGTGGTWLWTAETSWQETTPGGGPFFESGIEIFDVAWGHGSFVAVGNRAQQQEAAAWTSTDGRTWSEAPSFAPSGTSLYAVEATTAGWAALGVDQSGGLSAWWSPDGAAWQPVELPQPQEGFPTMTPGSGNVQLAAFGDGLMALAGSAGATNPTRLWWSGDGRSWTSLGMLDGYVGGAWDRGGRAMARHDALVVLVTQQDEPVGRSPTSSLLWRGEID